jgi:hypothetical protein
VNWLHERDSALFIPAKNIEAPPLNIISSRALLLGILVTVPVPMLVFAAGIFIIIRRKRVS